MFNPDFSSHRTAARHDTVSSQKLRKSRHYNHAQASLLLMLYANSQAMQAHFNNAAASKLAALTGISLTISRKRLMGKIVLVNRKAEIEWILEERCWKSIKAVR